MSVAPQSWRGAHSWCVWATLWRRVLDSTKKAFFGRDETGNFLSHIFKLNSWKNNSNRLMTENCTVSSSSWGDRSGFQSECFTLCDCQVAVLLCSVDIPPACKHSKQGSITSMYCRRSIWNPSLFNLKITVWLKSAMKAHLQRVQKWVPQWVLYTLWLPSSSSSVPSGHPTSLKTCQTRFNYKYAL